MDGDNTHIDTIEEENIYSHSIDNQPHIHDEDSLYDDVYQHEIGKSYVPTDQRKEFLKKAIVLGDVINNPRYKRRNRR